MNKNNLLPTRLGVLTISIALLVGCSSTPRQDHLNGATTVPSHWAIESNASALPDPWWLKFNDAKLTQLIESVLEQNDDLALATLTLKMARLEAGLTASDKYPEVSSSLDASRSVGLQTSSVSSSYSADLSLSYELDLWGRVSAEVEADRWLAMASNEDRESTAQSLAATSASLYWQIGYLNTRIALSNKSLDYARQTLALTEKQYQSGAVSQLNVLESKRSLAGQEASHSELEQLRVEASNSLALLLKQTPENTLNYIDTLPKTTLPDISAGLPADILARRPDVKAALYKLRSALADEDATTAAYFPTLTLTGSISDSSTTLSELLTDPIGTLGASLALPFLQWNELKLNQKISQLESESAVIAYRQTLYKAFEDVNNALSARAHYQYQGLKLDEQYQAAQAAERIYASQYQHGAVSIQDWLDAQETLRDAEESLLENHYNQYNIQATLYQALGGRDIAPNLEVD
jgi:NodT family efflux transporter outer membrane factor (OMF) lipoprotein